MAFDDDIVPILKESFGEKEVHSNLFRGSPTLAFIEKKRQGGKYYVVPMMHSRGGSVIGNYSLVAALAASRAKNSAFQVPYGNSFSWFNISSKEWNASDMDAGAFIQVAKEMFFAAGEILRQTNGAAVFGSGLGDVAIVESVDAATQLYIIVKQWGAMALDVDSRVVFATGPYATGALRSASAVQVSTVTPEDSSLGTVRITFSSAYAATVAAGDWVLLYGFGSTTAPLNYFGFRSWLPTVGDRTGATWTAYIATAFCGVDRSVYPTRLAGEFVLRDNAGSEKYSDAILRGVRAVRRNGGKPDMIVVNDFDFAKIVEEIEAYKQFFQKINGPDMGGKVELTHGLSAMAFAMSTTWISYVVDDSFCPQGLAYILEKETWGMAMLSSPVPISENLPATNEAGAPAIASAGSPPGTYAFNFNDYVTAQPADTADGPGLRVTLACHPAMFCRQPSHNCVVKLDVTMP